MPLQIVISVFFLLVNFGHMDFSLLLLVILSGTDIITTLIPPIESVFFMIPLSVFIKMILLVGNWTHIVSNGMDIISVRIVREVVSI